MFPSTTMLYIWLLIYLMGAVVSSAVYLYLPADLYLFFQLASWKLLTYITQNYVHNGEKLAAAD